MQVALGAGILHAGTICFNIYKIHIHGSSRGRGIVESEQQGFISTSRFVALYPDKSKIYENHVCLVDSEVSSLSPMIPVACLNVCGTANQTLTEGGVSVNFAIQTSLVGLCQLARSQALGKREMLFTLCDFGTLTRDIHKNYIKSSNMWMCITLHLYYTGLYYTDGVFFATSNFVDMDREKLGIT